MLFDKNFFPTPFHVCQKMCDGVEIEYKTRILEPSAGKGDILDFITKHRDGRVEKLYCIEKNPELAMILQKKKYQYIADDFLEYDSEGYDFDLIIMNPPFDNGAKHLLKAWEIARNTEIVCLLNGETVRNPYTKERERLLKLIEEHGSIEFLGDCFASAERKTCVEVAMIRMTKKVEQKRYFDGFTMDDEKEFKTEKEKGIISANFIDSFVAQYNHAVKMAKTADEYMKRASETISAIFEDDNFDFLERVEKDGLNGAITSAKRRSWRALLEKMGADKYMTNAVSHEFSKKMEAQNTIAVSRKNIQNFVTFVLQNTGQFMEDAIVDIFDKCTQHYEENRVSEGWKTNSSFKINKKVILPFMVKFDSYGRGDQYSMSYSRSVSLYDLDKALCFVSGKNFDEIQHSERMIENFGRVGQKSAESTFFKMKWFKKGTLHLEFKDDYIWEEFNKRAAKGKKWIGE